MRCGFSVIIPFARPERWVGLCQQLAKVTYSGPYEFIVVLNCGAWKPKHLPPTLKSTLTIITETRRGPAYARNAGIKIAAHEYMVFFDDDCVVPPDILDRYEVAWKQHPQAKLLGGTVQARLDNDTALSPKQKHLVNQFGWCFGDIRYAVREKRLKLMEPLFAANLSIHQNLQQRSYFPVELGFTTSGILVGGEDCLLCYLTIAAGLEVWYVASLRVGNLVSHNRFTWSYITFRSFLAGIERWVMDARLGSQSGWVTVPTMWRRAIQSSWRGDSQPLLQEIRQPFSGWQVAGYIVGSLLLRR